MTVLEHLKAAGYDIDRADYIFGSGHAECDEVEIKTCVGTAGYKTLLIVEARAFVDFSDGGKRPYPDGWDGEKNGNIVTAYLEVEE